jgi:hypothetical protein
MLGKGANAAVHAAAWSNPAELFASSEPEPEPKRIRRGSSFARVVEGDPDVPLSTPVSSDKEPLEYPLAVKVMFNYDVMSDVGLILRAMRKETVPCLSLCLQGRFG